MTCDWFHPSPSRHHDLLRIAAALVPRDQRAEWLAEWRSELWYVEQRPNSDTRKLVSTATVFCLGGFKDALWVLCHVERTNVQRKPRLRSARQCIAFLGSLAVISVACALLLPDTRRAILPTPFHDPQGLAVISTSTSLEDSELAISIRRYQSWSEAGDQLLTGTAFYVPITTTLRTGARPSAELAVALSSDSLLRLMNAHVPQSLLDGARHEGAVPILVSHEEWQRCCADDPHTFRRIFDAAGHKAIVVGIAPENSDQLPGRIDAWLFEGDREMKPLLSQHFNFGYMVARVTPSASSGHPSGILQLTMPGEDGGTIRARLVMLTTLAHHHQWRAAANFLHALLLACLVLPIALPISRGNYSTTNHSSETAKRNWIFLAAKFVLILPVVYCGPLLVAHLCAPSSFDSHWTVQSLCTFVGSMFSVHWVLKDQQQRCPLCLRLLTNPVHVGESSRNFLEWGGTEFVCGDGHGLLHVPDFPTSWFATQRWISLDPSWQGLFVGRPSPP